MDHLKTFHPEHEEICKDVEIEDEGYTSQVVDPYLAKVNNVDTKPPSTSWYLDSGASNYITGDSFIFSSFSPSNGTKITSVGGGHDVTQIGSVAICLPTGKIQKINNLLYSPSIMKNLLSVGYLTDKEFKLSFFKQGCIITNPEGRQIAMDLRDHKNGFYELAGDTLYGCSDVSIDPKVNVIRCLTH